MHGLFSRSMSGLAGLRAVVIALILCIGGYPLAGPQEAFAQAIAGCDAVNGGDLNFTVPQGGAGNDSLNGHTFVVGDVLTFTWSDANRFGAFNSVAIFINGASTITSTLPAGTATYTIIVPATDIFVSVSDLGGGALPAHTPTFSATCTSGPGGPVVPPTPPIVPIPIDPQAFIDQDTGSATASILGDAEPHVWEVPAVSLTDNDCDELLRKWKKMMDEVDRKVVQALKLRQILEGMRKDGTTAHSGYAVNNGLVQPVSSLTGGLTPASQLDFAQSIESLAIDVDVLLENIRAIEPYLKPCGFSIVEARDHPELRAPLEPGSPQPREYTSLDAFDILQGRQGTPTGPTRGREDAGGKNPPIEYDWKAAASGTIYALDDVAGPDSAGVNGRVDVTVSRQLPNGATVGGFIGWDATTTRNAATGGTTSSNAIHFGAFGSYVVPSSDIILAVSGGTAFGALKSTIGTDSGTTATQRAFLKASVNGTIAEDGPWRTTAAATLFIGAEHQNAFTTSGGIVVPEQTITIGKADVTARFSYTLPTELPMELFGTIGVGGVVGNAAPFKAGQLSATVGGGLTISRDDLHATISATTGLIGPLRSWTLSATLGGTF